MTGTRKSRGDVSREPGESAVIAEGQLKRTFRALTAARIRWCLLRGEDRITEAGEDLDLLIADTDEKRARAVLGSCNFLPMPVWDNLTHTHYVAYEPRTDRWLKLDVVHQLAYGPAFGERTDAASGVLDRRRWVGDVALPSPDDSFWTLLWHCLLDKGTFPRHHAARLQELVPSTRQDSLLARKMAELLPPHWDIHDVIARIEQGEFDTLEPLARELHSRSGRRKSRHMLAPLTGLLRRASFRVSRPGVTVTFLAPDGAGKSTLATGMQRSFPFPVHVTWLGQSPTPVAPVILLGMAVPGTVLVRQLFRIWTSYLHGAWHRAQGRLVIFDRYVYDQRFVLERDISVRERVYFLFLTHAIPQPDLVVVLDVPGDVMFERKGEHSPEELELQLERFLSVGHSLSNGIIVDAVQDEDTVRRTVTQLVWQKYVSRWTRSRRSDNRAGDVPVASR